MPTLPLYSPFTAMVRFPVDRACIAPAFPAPLSPLSPADQGLEPIYVDTAGQPHFGKRAHFWTPGCEVMIKHRWISPAQCRPVCYVQFPRKFPTWSNGQPLSQHYLEDMVDCAALAERALAGQGFFAPDLTRCTLVRFGFTATVRLQYPFARYVPILLGLGDLAGMKMMATSNGIKLQDRDCTLAFYDPGQPGEAAGPDRFEEPERSGGMLRVEARLNHTGALRRHFCASGLANLTGRYGDMPLFLARFFPHPSCVQPPFVRPPSVVDPIPGITASPIIAPATRPVTGPVGVEAAQLCEELRVALTGYQLMLRR